MQLNFKMSFIAYDKTWFTWKDYPLSNVYSSKFKKKYLENGILICNQLMTSANTSIFHEKIQN